MKLVRVLYNKFVYRRLIRRRLGSCGRSFRLGYSSELLNPGFFSIGNNFFSGPYNYLVTNKFNPVFIGSDVMFGPFCKIIGGNHNYRFSKAHMCYNSDASHMGAKIVIENGVWIGANTTILSGAHISEGAVVGAMSLVNKYVPPYCVAVGIPATRFRQRFESSSDLQTLLHNVHSRYTVSEILGIHESYGIAP